jgi:hypothetical protein
VHSLPWFLCNTLDAGAFGAYVQYPRTAVRDEFFGGESGKNGEVPLLFRLTLMNASASIRLPAAGRRRLLEN